MVRCPCCGNVTDIPILFKGLRQYVLTYIWQNPNCTANEINKQLFAGEAAFATISAHLSQIRKRIRHHGYALVSQSTAKKTKHGRRPFQYKIIEPRLKAEVKGTENALA